MRDERLTKTGNEILSSIKACYVDRKHPIRDEVIMERLNIAEGTLRNHLNAIRKLDHNNNYVLCGWGAGYFWSNKLADIERTRKWYERPIGSRLKVVSVMKKAERRAAQGKGLV